MLRVDDLTKLTEDELYNLAREYQIKGRTEMGRDELVTRLRELVLEKDQTQVEKEVRDLGTPASGHMEIPNSFRTGSSSFTGGGAGEKTELQVKVASPFFDSDPLPEAYGDNRIVLVPKNPQWAYSYWEIAEWKVAELKSQVGEETVRGAKLALRVYDVSLKTFDGNNANNYFDIELPEGVREWFIGGLNPKASYVTDIGFKTPNGQFLTLARSNNISTPSNVVSDRIDEEWMIIEEYFKKIMERSSAGRIVDGKWIGGMGASGAMLGSSEEMLAIMLRRLFIEKGGEREKLLSHLEKSLGSLSIGSLGMGSLSAGSLSASKLSIGQGQLEKDKGAAKKKDFWLTVGTELILYGATEPDANVTVMGKPIKLKADGTFSLRFALPNGHYELPVIAVNADGDDTRQITPIVDRTEV